jgi:hypothetical protein
VKNRRSHNLHSVKRLLDEPDTSREGVPMPTCPSCRANVADGLAWCNQCYASLEVASAAEATSPPDERPLWLRSNAPGARSEQATEFSRLRKGSTSFSPVGRVLLTFGVFVLLVVGYPLLRGLMVASVGFDVPGTGFVIMYVCVAIPSGVYLLNRVWKRDRIA